jgi:hypothetical protein
MAIKVLTNARLWLDAWDLSGDLNKIAMQYGADLQDATTFGNLGGKARKGGLKSTSLALEGFWSGGVDLVDEVLWGKVGTVSVPITISDTGVAGDPGSFSFLAGLAQYTPGAAVGEMLKFSVDAESSDDALIRGILLRNSIETANGNGTAFAQGLVGTGQKLWAALHVVSVAGGGTWTFKVQSDTSGFPSPIDRIVFTAVTVKGSQWAVPVAGPIATDDNWRATWSVAGGAGNSITFAMFMGIQ